MRRSAPVPGAALAAAASRSSEHQRGVDQRPAQLSAHLMRFGASSLLILSFPTPETDILVRLTAAERGVAILVASGETNLAIAHRRGVSKNTIAKQVAAILRKTNVTSRFELIALLSGARCTLPI